MKKSIWVKTMAIALLIFSFNSLAGETTPEDKLRIKTLEDQFDNINNKVGNYYIREINTAIKKNQTTLEQTKDAIKNNEEKISTNKEKIKLAEENKQKLAEIEDRLRSTEVKTGSSTDFISRLWILIAAAMVFLMQAGFKVFEFGLVRKQHIDGIGMKNLVDCLVVCIVFYLLGFGIMFGPSGSFFNIFGTDLFLPTVEDMEPNLINELKNIKHAPLGFEFFLFQLAFAATAATIVSGAMSERTAFIPYILTACFVGLLAYPIFGHWVWGNAYNTTNIPWLVEYLDFKDFAGSTVVHSIGAWVALVGIWKLGPRIGRFNPDGSVNTEDFKSYSLGYSVLGIFLLWFGWWGFNGGSAYELFSQDKEIDVASIILNTNIAAAFGGMAAFFDSYIRDKPNVYVKLMGGVLGGLVAITASCNIVSSETSMVIGILAGFVHNLSYDWMLKMKLDDPVGAIPVHGFCGVLGTLCVCLGKDYLFTSDMFVQFSKQLLGALFAFFYAISFSWMFFSFITRFFNIRVSPREEKFGYLVGEED